MKKIQTIIATLGILLLFACEEKDGMGSRVGYLRLSVGESNAVETKADEEPAYDPKAFAVKITDKKTSAVVEEFDAWAVDESKLIKLEEGTYVISASSANYDEEPGFNKPYYAGSKEVAIKAGDELNETLTCTLANVKVSVVFDEKLLEKYADRTISVSVGATGGTPMNFGKDNCGRDVQAYFPAGGDLTAKISITKPSGETGVYSDEYTLEKVEAKHYYVLTYKLESTGSGDFNITYNPNGWTEYEYVFEVDPVASNVATLSANPWAKFAYLTASDAKSATGATPVNPKLQYRQQGTDVWNDLVTTTTGEGEEAVYTATATSLTPNTTYEYRLVGDNDFEITPMQFTTEEATVLYNGNFDIWNYGKEDYSKTWFAEAADKAGLGTSFWDSGNIGTSTYLTSLVGVHNPTSPDSTDVNTSGGKAAKLASEFVGFMGAGKFAAGNIYTGNYCETFASPMGARIRFGKEFTSRPTQLKGWYKYTRGETIDEDNNSTYTEILKQAGGDLCSVYIALVDNDGLQADNIAPAAAFEIDNRLEADDPEHFKYKNTIDFSVNNPHVIAYGELSAEEAAGTGSWKDFTIDLKYRDLTRVPKYIIVVASASKYGDYFTGSTSSVMYIDDFSLVYGDEPKVKE